MNMSVRYFQTNNSYPNSFTFYNLFNSQAYFFCKSKKSCKFSRRIAMKQWKQHVHDLPEVNRRCRLCYVRG